MGSTKQLNRPRTDKAPQSSRKVRSRLLRGTVIPAHPLALTSDRRLDERRQRGLSRYYLDSGAGGLAVGVHTTQYQIHDPSSGLLKPVLSLAAEEMDNEDAFRQDPLIRVAGICGDLNQAVHEAKQAHELGYQYGLVNLGALRGRSIKELIDHCRGIAEVIGLFGFYLQPKVGGVDLPIEFWRQLCTIDRLVAIKVAAFNRYKTLDVLRAVAESGRNDIALYTGNDDNIVADLITSYPFRVAGQVVEQRFCGGLLGQWAVWTQNAVETLQLCQQSNEQPDSEQKLLQLSAELTDANGAIFDAANDFRGCIPGIHEVLRRQGLLENNYCLDDSETLSPGQAEEIDRVTADYRHLQDDSWVAERLDHWLRG